jgi:hypothetical protein
MLHHLKNTPSPKVQGSSDGTKSSKQPKKKRSFVDSAGSSSVNASIDKPKRLKTKLTIDSHSESVSSGRRNEFSSPVSRAMMLLNTALHQSPRSQTLAHGSESENVPLHLLSHFRYLNEAAQRNLLMQLIERFQRTSITPRNANINTPRWGNGGVLGFGPGMGINGPETPHLGDMIDPNCFEDFSGPSTTDQASVHHDDFSMHTVPMDPLHDDKRRSKFKGIRLGSSNTQNSEEAAVEVAAVVAQQIISKTSVSEKLLKMLIDDKPQSPHDLNSSKSFSISEILNTLSSSSSGVSGDGASTSSSSSNNEFPIPLRPSRMSRIDIDEPLPSPQWLKKLSPGGFQRTDDQLDSLEMLLGGGSDGSGISSRPPSFGSRSPLINSSAIPLDRDRATFDFSYS